MGRTERAAMKREWEKPKYEGRGKWGRRRGGGDKGGGKLRGPDRGRGDEGARDLLGGLHNLPAQNVFVQDHEHLAAISTFKTA